MRATKLSALTAAALFTVTLAACGDNAESGEAAPAAPTMSAPAMSAPAMSAAPSMATDMVNFGPGCSAVPADPADKGSFQAMAQVPVATAASGNPLLSTLVTAVKKAGLVDSLNTAEAVTVFAPTDDAFGKLPKADLDKVLADKKMLTDVLTYHVVPGKLTPGELAGPHKTLQGADLTVSGSGSDFTVNGESAVVCGNVQTANATVYIVDTVLMPTS